MELTERAFLEDEAGMHRRMESLRERGFLFHRPMSVEAFDALLLQQECEYDRTK